jgi:hypothetical protein
MTKSSRI